MEINIPDGIMEMVYGISEEPPIRYKTEKNMETQKYSQWLSLPDGKFKPSLNTVESIPSGLYDLTFSNREDSMILIKKSFNLDELYELPSPEITSILNDIKTFWDKKNIFQQYGYIHKRGILLYGEPGCGKSGIIQLCVKHVIESMNGIVFNIKDSDAVDHYIENISTFRQIEPERPIIVILEDIDSIVGEDKYSTSQVLNVLDGIKQINNVVYIATTNYPEKLEERVSARPSRFDRRYQIELPTAEIREAYIKAKLGPCFKDIKEWVSKTEGMSLAHLREVIISVEVFEMTLDDIIKTLNGNKGIAKISKGKKGGIGFGS